MKDTYGMGDPDQWIEDITRDAMRPINRAVSWDELVVPPNIRKHPNINAAQIQGVVALMESYNEQPSAMDVVNINGCFAVRVEFGEITKIVTKSHEGDGYHIEHPIDFELIVGGIMNEG